MTQPNNKLNQLQSTFVCPTSWEAMAGNHRKRFCSECRKHVYDFSQMTRREVAAVTEAARGNLCARVTRNPDGSIQTQEVVSPSLHLISRRASPLAAAVVSAMLGITPALATNAMIAPPSAIQLAPTAASQQKTDGATAAIIGTVVDPQGAVIPGVTVTLTNLVSSEQKVTKTSENGAYRFENLAVEKYALKAELTPFKTTIVTDVQLLAGQQTTVEIRMEIGVVSVTMGAMAIPERPLRALYERSALVVDAIAGKSVPVESEKETNLVKTELRINEIFKGQSKRKTIYLYHWNYEHDEPQFNYGDQLLLFLTAREEGQPGYELSDSGRGLKKLSARDLAAYTLHLQELETLTIDRQPTAAEIADWLVRCTLDPATRWEGARDLRDGFRELQACEQEKKQKAEAAKAAAKEAVAQLQEELEEDKESEPDLAQQLAAQLTAAQKERLTNTLLAIEKLSEQDYELLYLAAHWDQDRVVSYLLRQLRQIAATAPHNEASGLTRALAVVLADEELDKLTEPFNEVDLYADEPLDGLDYSEEERAEIKEKAPLAPAKRKSALTSILRYVELKQRLPRSQ